MVIIDGKKYKCLCASRNLWEIYYIYRYLYEDKGLPIRIYTDEEVYVALVYDEMYENVLKKLWDFSSKSVIKGIDFYSNKSTFFYFFSKSLFDNIRWYDVNDNTFLLNERVVAKCMSNKKFYGKSGSWVFDEVKSYLNDFTIYLSMNDIYVNYCLYKDRDNSSDFLLVVYGKQQDIYVNLLRDFVSEYGCGPFSDIQFLDEIGRVIGNNSDKVKKISKK